MQESELQPGLVFASRYRVLERLGAGSTATVYKVQDLLANDVVALKVLRPAAAQNPKVIAGFKRELAMTRKLTHPNVVGLFDLGAHEGLFYIVMEFVDGQTLARYLAEVGHLALPEFLTLFEEFCKALSWVHSHNVVHRDIKPSNVMFTSGGTLKLMDFGIAKDVSGQQLGSTIIGTPGYIAPEQQLGMPLGPTADIYSAGALFFELLTGKRASAKGLPALLPEEIRNAAPDLQQILTRSMETSPLKRFQTVEELRQAAARIQRKFSPVSHGRIRISDRIGEDPADLGETIPLFLKVVNRVNEIHGSGRYHSELSPRNIWVTNTGAVEIDCCDTPRAQGTLGASDAKYLAPEVFADAAESGPHSCASRDMYVLGFAFYELLAGQRNFQRQFHSAGEGQNDRAWLSWHGDPSKSLQPLGEILPRCPKPLAELIGRMASKDSTQRPPTLDKIAEVLLKLHLSTEDTQPLSAPPPPPPGENEQGAGSARRNTRVPVSRGPVQRVAPMLFRMAWHGLRGGWGVALALLLGASLLVGAAVVYANHRQLHSPAAFRLDSKALLVLDENGIELWRKTLDSEVEPARSGQTVWFGDLDGDGHTETLFLLRPKNPADINALVCYSDKGVERWRFVPGKTVSTRRQSFPPPYEIMGFLAGPFGKNHAMAILVNSIHFLNFPTQVALLSPQGEMLNEYWHAGQLRQMLIADLDGDGASEFYLGGISAGRSSAEVVVLQPDRMSGASDEATAPDFQLQGFGPGRERARIFFPRSCMNQKLERANRVSGLQTENGDLVVSLLELLQASRPTMTFRLAQNLSLRKLELSSSFFDVHQRMEKTGELDHAFSAQEEARLREIVVLQ